MLKPNKQIAINHDILLHKPVSCNLKVYLRFMKSYKNKLSGTKQIYVYFW